MGQITFQDIEYTCRSLNDGERKKWDEAVKEAAKAIWRPAEDYWKKLGNIPNDAKKHCLAEYLKSLNWDAPPKEVRVKALTIELIQQLMLVMSPLFPQELITRETAGEILGLLDPYFIEIKTNG